MKQIFSCPRTGQVLEVAASDVLQQCQTLAAAGRLMFNSGSPVSGALTELLITADGKVAYVVEQGIPRLLPELAISLAGLNRVKSVE